MGYTISHVRKTKSVNSIWWLTETVANKAFRSLRASLFNHIKTINSIIGRAVYPRPTSRGVSLVSIAEELLDPTV